MKIPGVVLNQGVGPPVAYSEVKKNVRNLMSSTDMTDIFSRL